MSQSTTTPLAVVKTQVVRPISPKLSPVTQPITFLLSYVHVPCERQITSGCAVVCPSSTTDRPEFCAQAWKPLFAAAWAAVGKETVAPVGTAGLNDQWTVPAKW